MNDVNAAARPSEEDSKVRNQGPADQWPDPGEKGPKKEDATQSTATQEPTSDPLGKDLGHRPS